MNRRGTSLALAVGVPGALLGATAVLAQQVPAPAPPAGPAVIPATGELLDPQSKQPVGTFAGEITDAAVTAVTAVDGPDGKKQLQLTGRLSGTGTVDGQARPLSQPVAVTGFLVPEGTPLPTALPAEAAAGAVVPIVAPLAPAAQATPPSGASCQVLLLQIPDGLTLNLLGLEVLLAALRLDILAVRGAGNLLGNLLCAVVNLLNGINLAGLLGGLGNVAQLLGSLSGALDDLLAALNDLLSGA